MRGPEITSGPRIFGKKAGPLRSKVVLVVILLLALGSGPVEHPSARHSTEPARPAPLLPVLPAAQEVWRKAAFTVPQEINGVGDVRPATMVDRDVVLMVHDGDPDDRRTALLTYNHRTGRHRLIGKAPERESAGEILAVTTDTTRIAWISGDDLGAREVWAAPWRDGHMKRLASRLDGPKFVEGLRLDAAGLVWWGDGEIHRMPPEGGAITRVEVGDSLRTSSWPWIQNEDRSLTNMSTGQTRRIGRLDGSFARCGPAWCVSEASRRTGELTQVVVQRLDGTGRQLVPAEHLQTSLYRERFGFFGPPFIRGQGKSGLVSTAWAIGTRGTAVAIYDRCAGRVALLDPPDAPAPYTVYVRYNPGIIRLAIDGTGLLMYWNAKGSRHQVLDLTGVDNAACS
ncbi:hypothetical protein ACIHFD_14705 [Nonomuraea sp. NPDC051941]|uniref:hypothetical protein n=1 Tax=Nonomuraea sp. NPDC051941 TaxID=3364373 RepID=UPI0037CA5406